MKPGKPRHITGISEVAPDGSVVVRQRWLGTFTHALDLRSFPLDQATFRVQLVLPGYRPDEIEFEPQPTAVAAGLRGGVGRAEQFTLQDWRVLSTAADSKPYTVFPGLELRASHLSPPPRATPSIS